MKCKWDFVPKHWKWSASTSPSVRVNDRRWSSLKRFRNCIWSWNSVQIITTNDLGYQTILTRWIPRLLIADQKQQRLQVYRWLLIRNAFSRWVHNYTSESKEATKVWRKKGRVVFVNARLSAGKVHKNLQFPRCFPYLLHSRTSYHQFSELLDKETVAHRRKRPGFPIQNIIVLHDNTLKTKKF